MDFVFRKLSPAESVVTQPGEIYLLPALADQRGRRDLARFVLEHGPKGLLSGPGTPQRLVIDADPKLDDMLAAFFVRRQLGGHAVPEIYDSAADYTAQLREGFRPTQLPLENSLEGIFLAMRARAEKSLTDLETRRQFIADWLRLESVIIQAAEQKLDLATTPLFEMQAQGTQTFSLLSLNRGEQGATSEGEFVRETVFLAKDMDAYQQDFARGEKWRVRLPGDFERSSGLLLRSPKSLLFKYWTRSPCPSPCGGPYRFLAVTWENGQWAFSTSSPEKISLKPLAELLQAAERKHAPAKAETDHWNAGKAPFTTLVSPRGGTQLAEPVVLRVVRRWCRARSGHQAHKGRRIALLAGCLAVIAALGLYLFLARPWLSSSPSQLAIHDIYIISVGVADYPQESLLPKLDSPADDAAALVAAFKKLEGSVCKKVVPKTITNKDATRQYILESVLNSWLHKEQSLTSRSLVILTFAGHGDIEGGSDSYHFCPYDYDPEHPTLSGIFLPDLQRLTGNLPCPVIVVLDTCHSGAARNEDPKSPQSLLKNIHSSVSKASGTHGLIVMAACGPHQEAAERGSWGHGALTLALLEGIEGKYRYFPKDPKKSLPTIDLPKPSPDGVVTLDQLDRYVTSRVEVLSSEMSRSKHRQQETRMYSSGNVTPAQIPIAIYK